MTRLTLGEAFDLLKPGMSTDGADYKAALKKAQAAKTPLTEKTLTERMDELAVRLDALANADNTESNPDDQPEATMADDKASDEDDDALNAQIEYEAGLADLAADLTAHFNELTAPDNTVSLMAPELLTVEIANRGFRKKNHIGGEEFMPYEAYVGKSGKIIIKFKPLDTVEYHTMEMPTLDAIAKLANFVPLTEMGGNRGSFNVRMQELSTQRSRLREAASIKDKFEQYKDIGFGSF